MGITRRLQEQERVEEELQRQKEALYQRNAERSARRKAELAEKLDSNEMFVAAIVFYCRRLKPGRRVPAAPIRAHHRKLSREWQLHLKAARRLLGVWYDFPNSTYRLPNTFARRLISVGLNISGSTFEGRAFRQLNADLILDDALGSFAAGHPVLERAKQLLSGYEYHPLSDQLIPPARSEPREPPDVLSVFLQRKLTRHLSGRGISFR